MNIIRSIVIITLLLSLNACSTDSGSDQLSPEELIEGRWVLQSAIIDGNGQPITTPGLGQIALTVNSGNYTYIYPELGSNNLPNGQTDTLSGTWEFSSDYSTFTLDRSDYQQEPFVWEILRLSNGVFDTQYVERSAAGGAGTSTYNFTYRLAN